LLSELVPKADVIALLVNPNDVQEASRVKGLQLHILKADSEGEIETAFASLVQTASRRASGRPRRVLPQPTRPALGVGITPGRSDDLSVA
jgi:hypothetical protein